MTGLYLLGATGLMQAKHASLRPGYTHPNTVHYNNIPYYRRYLQLILYYRVFAFSEKHNSSINGRSTSYCTLFIDAIVFLLHWYMLLLLDSMYLFN